MKEISAQHCPVQFDMFSGDTKTNKRHCIAVANAKRTKAVIFYYLNNYVCILEKFC